MLTSENASEYAISYFRNECAQSEARVIATRDSDDGRYIAVDVEFWPHSPIATMDVWEETAPDGTQYLYGEW